jgi:3-carboxy-cis,cis-muconate cycloisomerase
MLLRDIFGTERMRAVFDSRALLQSWLDVEAALAEAESEIGLIPEAAAAEIRAAARAEHFDLDDLRAGIERSQHPLVPVVEELSAAAGESGTYVHWGATTQDVMDTAVVLQVRAGLHLVEDELGRLVARLAELAERYAGTPMAGRTHGQHAVPITFGLVVGVWLDELGRARVRLAACRERVLVGELAGAAGTLASLGSDGPAVREAFCRRLGLGVPTTPWHTARDGFAELVSALAGLAATMEKIALAVVRLQSTEIAEAGERPSPEHVGSSTMPQKRNPMASEYVAATCKLVRGLAPVMQGAMIGEHERDMASWAAEWLLIPQAFVLTDGALSRLTDIAASLEVDEARMAANLELTRGAILAERVMLALGRHVGRVRAHELMTEVTRDAERRGVDLLVALRANPQLTSLLDEAELERLLIPESYLGEAADLARAAADRAVANSEEREPWTFATRA